MARRINVLRAICNLSSSDRFGTLANLTAERFVQPFPIIILLSIPFEV